MQQPVQQWTQLVLLRTAIVSWKVPEQLGLPAGFGS
jgi:hypothetical protein